MGQATFLVGVLGEVFANGGRGPYCGKDSAGPRTPLAPSAAFFFSRYSFATGLVIFSGGSEYLTPKGALIYGMDHASARRD